MFHEPYRSRERHPGHWCAAVGSTVYCEIWDCPYCDVDEDEAGPRDPPTADVVEEAAEFAEELAADGDREGSA